MSLYKRHSGPHGPGAYQARALAGISSALVGIGLSRAVEPTPKTPRREPTAMEWRCGCGRIHKRAVDECAACGGRK